MWRDWYLLLNTDNWLNILLYIVVAIGAILLISGHDAREESEESNEDLG